MEQQPGKALWDRYKAGHVSKKEKQLILNWFHVLHQDDLFDLKEEELEQLHEDMLRNVNRAVLKPEFRIKPWLRLAAAILAIIIGFVLFHYSGAIQNSGQAGNHLFAENDIKPGGNKAYLTLGNGKKISLTDAKNGAIAEETGVEISKINNGHLVYAIQNANPQHRNKKKDINIIETPRGGQYQLTLPDHTKVWLNADSRLEFPSNFKGLKYRTVKLKGEAYFEVSKDRMHPFVVQTELQEVEVLGTHFNVNSYPDEPETITTLLEGRVNVCRGTVKQVLRPGQQAVNTGKSLQVGEANIESIMDWKNGDFYLNHINFRMAMRKISRWYNVEVIYDSSVPDDIESGGWISRNNSLLSVLQLMEASGLVQFKVTGKKIYISKSK